MKYIFTLIICLLNIQFLPGQEFEWARVESTNISTNPFMFNHSVALDTAEQPIYARLIKKKLTYGTIYMGDICFDKYDSFGTLIRSDTLIGKIHVENILTDKANNLLAYGSFRDTIWVDSTNHLIIPGGNNHEFILKLDAMGEVAWLKDYAQIDPEIYGINALAIDHTNSIWIGVQHLSYNTSIKKLDANGIPTTTYTQTGVLGISGLAFDDVGNLWVTGPASSGNQSFNGYSANGPFTYSFYVTRYSPGGVANWVQFVEDVTFQSPQIACDGSGNAYVSDRLNGSFAFGSITSQGPEWVNDFFLTKIDTGGNFVWLREVPAGNSNGDASIGVKGFLTCSDDNNIYLVGFTRGSVNWGNGIVTNSVGYIDFLTLKYSSTGELLWAKNGGSPGGDRAEAVAVDKNDNCYITGIVGENAVFDSLTFSGDFSNSFLAKLTDDNITSIKTEQRSSPSDFRLSQNHPNPFNPITHIQFEIPHTGNELSEVKIIVYDLQGRKVKTLFSGSLPAGKYEAQWDGRNQSGQAVSSGVYIYSLEAGSLRQADKMILIR